MKIVYVKRKYVCGDFYRGRRFCGIVRKCNGVTALIEVL